MWKGFMSQLMEFWFIFLWITFVHRSYEAESSISTTTTTTTLIIIVGAGVLRKRRNAESTTTGTTTTTQIVYDSFYVQGI